MESRKYMLDTNAYFKVLCSIGCKSKCLDSDTEENLTTLIRSHCCVSQITLIEIISVIGQYSRGKNNNKRWKRKQTQAWLKLTKDITRQRSSIFNLQVLPFSELVFMEAESFVEKALIFNFGSMDAFIASTAIVENRKGNNIIVVTEDKSLKSAMRVTDINHIDMLKNVIYQH